jgi:hypothetical protein
MTFRLPIAFLACLAVAHPLPALAQAKCPEGMTASGQCVDPRLAAGARQAGIIFSIPKISYTAYPILPNGDVRYRYPNQLIPDPNSTSISTRPCVPAPRGTGC